MKQPVSVFALFVVLVLLVSPVWALGLRQVVENTLKTNPGIEATQASKRATGYQLQQSQGRLFPEISLQGDVGLQKTDKKSNETSSDNNKWLTRREVSISVRQVLFDGWQRRYDILRNAARLDAAALSVFGAAETTALEAIDVYLDTMRNQELVWLSRQNVSRHKEILAVVKAQFDGGRAPLSDVNQIRGRVAAAQAVVEVMRQSLLNARAKFTRVVGLKPTNLKKVRRYTKLPRGRLAAVERGIANNPNILAASAQVKAAEYAYGQSSGALLPEIALEGSATHGLDVDGAAGRDDELAVKLTFSWKLFDGSIRANRQRELSERLTQQRSTQELRQREIVESIERAWNSLVTGRGRVAALKRQVVASEAVVSDFLKEYELSKRTLLEVLDAESLLFNARVQSISAQAIRTLAGYQVLAAMGELLLSMNIDPPAEVYGNADVKNIDWTGPFDIFVEPLR